MFDVFWFKFIFLLSKVYLIIMLHFINFYLFNFDVIYLLFIVAK